MTLQLTVVQVEALRKVAYPLCDQEDVTAALARYPGALVPGDCFPNTFNLNTLTQSCITAVALENGYYSQAFVLRLIEQKWEAEAMRRGVVGAVPTLVRPPRGFGTHVDALAAALDAMTDRLAAQPVIGDVGEVAVFRRFCDARDALAAMAASLTSLATLKALHDGLHMLQVLGAEWLDAFGGETQGDAAVGPLLALLVRLGQVASVNTADLSVEAAASFANCATIAAVAARRLQTGDAAEVAFALATLRALLVRELPAIDGQMFKVSRDVPVRELCALFVSDPPVPAVQQAWTSAIDLADTLRRRLMEHALWQAADINIYALEQTLARPAPTLVAAMQRLLPWTLRDLRLLLESPYADAVIAAMNDALLRYIMSTDGTPSPGGADPIATLEALRRAFADLRRMARSAFLAVDQAMRSDFSRLLGLQAPLLRVLARVPPHCVLMVPV